MRTSLGALVVVALLGTGLTTSTATADVTKPKVVADTTSGTALKVDWTDVKGATSYKVQYSKSSTFASGVTTLPAKGDPAITSSDTTITGLTTGSTYFVRVAAVTDAAKAKSTDSDSATVSAYSAATEAKATYKFDAPGDIFSSKVDRDSMTVSWKAVSGAPGYTVRVYSKGNPTKYFTTTNSSVSLTGLKASTTYYISNYVVQPAAGSTSEVRLSDSSLEIVRATTSYKLATPDGFKETSQSSTSVGLDWTGVSGAPDDAAYKVSYALDGAQTDHQKSQTFAKGTSGKLTGLDNDTTYYGVIYLVDHDGDRLSGSSSFITLKSLVPRGTISGKVSGASGSDLTAAAYTTAGNVADAVTVGSDNKYSLDVRPGSYKVQLMYTGDGNKASAWARSGSDGGWTYGAASTIEVDLGKTTNAPDVEIHDGHFFKGTVVDPNGDPVRDVDLTAIAANGDERDVAALTRSSSTGTFTLDGLMSGSYWIRASYSGDGFKIESRSLDASTDPSVKVTLETLAFRKKYTAAMHGTRKVGKTMNVTATPWLAGTYPTTRATMSFQWKRNGTAIKGATKSTYKLVSADRGKKLSVTATAKRYGYTTGSTTSTAKSIS